MSTKTIALDASVYDRLAQLKRQSESFSRVINRLIEKTVTAHTAADILAQLDAHPSLSETDADTMARLVRENRDTEDWPRHDLP